MSAFAQIDAQTLADWVLEQRWFGSKTRDVAHVEIIEEIPVRQVEPVVVLAMLEVRFHAGTHELYQVPLGARPAGSAPPHGVVARVDGQEVYDALTDLGAERELLHLMRGGHDLATADGTASFRRSGALLDEELQSVRPVGAEQSNTSLVFGERVVLKVYRRVGAGPNPELELVRFLSERGFPHIPALAGWYEYNGRLIDATLGIAQEFVGGATDGWDLALADLRERPERFMDRARTLGGVTGAMHTALSSDPHDPAFAPEETSVEALGLLTATVDEEIESMFLHLPDHDALGPLAGRGQEVRERLDMLTHAGSAGRVIRHHGDLHLGQAMLSQERWVVLDFEGEPARTLVERRRKRSPLRDVAGMLRSFSYAASASRILHGVPAPEGWESRVREAYLDGYFGAVEPSLLPPGRQATERLLAVFELEKAVYELRYELDNRPEWVDIPVAGIVRLLALDEEQTPR
ncbi:MAG TPA: hypothetical protein VGV40_07085 [Solirubrobacteraceae bacterium]|nr:hypothetical protein [Solirubrobacteraceae bacterium]